MVLRCLLLATDNGSEQSAMSSVRQTSLGMAMVELSGDSTHPRVPIVV